MVATGACWGAVEDDVKGLASRYMTDREAAVKALVSVAAGEQTALVPAISEQLEKGNWLVQHAAARVLQVYGPRAAAAAPALAKAALAGLKANRVKRTEVMLETLVRTGAGNTKGIADVAMSQLSDENPLAVEAALVALRAGGKEASTAVPAVIKVLEGKDVHLAASAAETLSGMGPKAADAVPALMAAVGGDRPKVARSAVAALGMIGPSAVRSVPTLIAALGKPDGVLVARSAEALGSMGPGAKPAVPALITTLGHESSLAADSAAKALKALGQTGVLGVIAGLQHRDPVVVARCAGVLEAGKVKDAVARLVKTLKHKDGKVVNAACRALVAIDETKKALAFDAWLRNVGSADEAAACQAMDTLSREAARSSDRKLRERAVTTLVEALRNRKGAAKRIAIVSLGRIGPDAEPGAGLIQEVIYGKAFRNEAIEAMKKIRPGKPVQLKPKAGSSDEGEDDLGLDL